MIVYLDSSVILRFVLQQPDLLPDWGKWDLALTSELSRIEAFRTMDRVRLEGRLDDQGLSEYVVRLNTSLSRLDEILLERPILSRAALAFPTVMGTLDALHVASALLWQEQTRKELVFLTHDGRQGIGARALGLQTSGF